ncbi:MAG: sensor histidine kinase [Chitinophagaceae bacterium]
MKHPRLQMLVKSSLLIILLLGYTGIQAQITDTIDITRIKLSENIRLKAVWLSSDPSAVKWESLSRSINQPIVDSFIDKITASLVEKDIYLKFVLHNSSGNSLDIYLWPGYYFQEMKLFAVNPATNFAEEISGETGKSDLSGFQRIPLQPHQTRTLISKLRFIKSSVNSLNPVLVQRHATSSFLTDLQNEGKVKNAITYVITGVLLMMIFYSMAVFTLNGSKEFLYYSGYAFFMGLMFFLKSFRFITPSAFNHFFESYFDFVLQCIGTFIYLAFMRKFIEARKNFPFLYKVLVIQQLLIVISLALFTYLNFFTGEYVLQSAVETSTKAVWLVGTVIFIAYAINVRTYLLNYLAAGQFFLLVCGLFSLFLISGRTPFFKNYPSVLKDSLFYFELGIVIELVFFLIALALKNRKDIVMKTKDGERLKLKNERQELEKQLAVFSAKQDERNRISADMHDELGSGVTAIRLMSEIVKSKMKENTLPEIHRISNAANDLINKMNTIIWTMKSENDSLQSLITYIRIYALEFFDNTSIDCSVNIPPVLPNLEISGEKRRNIFLSVKESLNNVLKHSKAGKVTITFLIDEHLIITITDDGVGIDLEKLRHFGSGLTNIKKRIESVEGSYRIGNHNGSGTQTTFELVI